MNVSVNGENVALQAGTTVRQLLERFDLGDQACAVEVNASIVPKAEHERRALADGDRVEIVTLVGGG